MLGLDNPTHLALILVLLLLVFGAKRLPEMGRSLGAGLRGFKQSISGEDHTEHLTAAQPAPVQAHELRESASAPTAEAGIDHTPMRPVV
jgi:sec-independent protein translocase protein TatA